MWRVNSAGLVSGRGTSVSRLWGGLPPDLPRLHAVLERQSDHAIIFISGISNIYLSIILYEFILTSYLIQTFGGFLFQRH